MMHAIKVQPLTGSSTRIAYNSSFSMQTQMPTCCHDMIKGENISGLLHVCLWPQCEQRSHVRKPGGETWAGER